MDPSLIYVSQNAGVGVGTAICGLQAKRTCAGVGLSSESAFFQVSVVTRGSMMGIGGYVGVVSAEKRPAQEIQIMII